MQPKNMKKIPLSLGGKNKGKFFAVVDDEDYKKLSNLRWTYSSAGPGYAEHGFKGKLVRMHRVIMNAQKGFMVDHINMNGLDNRKKNLRLCTKAENMRNRNMTKVNTSGYKGVVWDKINQKWVAQMKLNGKHLNFGRFLLKKDAAKAYNEGAKKYHGKFAKLNKF